MLQDMKGSLPVSSLIPFLDSPPPPKGGEDIDVNSGLEDCAFMEEWAQRPNGLPYGLVPKIAQVPFEALAWLLLFGLQELPLRRTRRDQDCCPEPD